MDNVSRDNCLDPIIEGLGVCFVNLEQSSCFMDAKGRHKGFRSPRLESLQL